MQFESRHGHNSSQFFQKLIIACPHERDTIFLNTLCKDYIKMTNTSNSENHDFEIRHLNA